MKKYDAWNIQETKDEQQQRLEQKKRELGNEFVSIEMSEPFRDLCVLLPFPIFVSFIPGTRKLSFTSALVRLLPFLFLFPPN